MKKTNWMMAVMVGAALGMSGPAVWAQDAKAPAKAAAPKAAAQKTFATPEEAAKALVEAVRAGNVPAMLAVIGPKTKDWLFTGDKVSDADDWKRFLEAYDKKNSVAKEGDAKATLVIGDDWPFPVPIAKRGDKWSFDADAGREEVNNRRIGRNELDTIQTLLAIADAQRDYAVADADKNGFNDYARRFISTPGKKDGLYWATKEGEPQSPLGPLVGEAAKEGYGKKSASGAPAPFHGYHYRMLSAQGKDAPGGAYDYVVKGVMLGGFAAVAYPAKHGVSGVMTFVVNHDGVVYEKDLGTATASAAVAMKSFNPDKTWKKVQ